MSVQGLECVHSGFPRAAAVQVLASHSSSLDFVAGGKQLCCAAEYKNCLAPSVLDLPGSRNLIILIIVQKGKALALGEGDPGSQACNTEESDPTGRAPSLGVERSPEPGITV